MPLATVTDLEARLGRPLTPTETARAAALLADASALITNYTGQTFTQVTGDVVTLPALRDRIKLPQRPVTAVTSVVALTCPSGEVGVTGWCFDGIDTINIAGWRDLVINLPTDLDTTACTYRVTYNHGYASVPADVTAVCCAAVNRALLSPSQVEGMISERIGQYTYQLQQGADGASGAATVRLSAADRAVLNRYRTNARTVAVRLP